MKEFSFLSAPTEVVVLNNCGPPVNEVNEYFDFESRAPKVSFSSSVKL